MNNTKSKFWQISLTVVAILFAIYWLKDLTRMQMAIQNNLMIWIDVACTMMAIVVAFFLGERHILKFLAGEYENSELYKSAKRCSYTSMVEAAFDAISRLKDQYNDTREDRLRIRVAYHGDTFASLIEALAAIPMYELNSTDATIALAGFKKNMIEIQHLVDQFIADRNRRGADILFPSAIAILDLRQYKVHAESHKQIFVNALKQID